MKKTSTVKIKTIKFKVAKARLFRKGGKTVLHIKTT